MQINEQKFWSRVAITANPDRCWEWLAGKAHGYGVHSEGRGKTVGSHRLAYQITYGEFNARLHVCHRCDNPGCCNPNHLFLGTQKDNAKDREAKGRGRKGRQFAVPGAPVSRCIK